MPPEESITKLNAEVWVAINKVERVEPRKNMVGMEIAYGKVLLLEKEWGEFKVISKGQWPLSIMYLYDSFLFFLYCLLKYIIWYFYTGLMCCIYFYLILFKGLESKLQYALKVSVVCWRSYCGAGAKESISQFRRWRRLSFDPWIRKIPWRRKWQPIQYFCLENPMDRGAWQASVHGVAKSQTQLSNWIHTHTHTHTEAEISCTSPPHI